MTVKLHNKGQRTIQVDGFDFKPDAVVSFPDDKSEKLLNLYVGEVFDIERSIAAFETSETFSEETEEEVAEEKRGRGRPPKA